MTSATVKRIFEVDAPLEEAWHRLAEVERWPEWAPHHLGDGLSARRARSHIKRCLQIKRPGRTTFRMLAWEPPVRWEWVGGLPGVRIYYDHRFESSGPAATEHQRRVAQAGPNRQGGAAQL